jgi:hypothetical protein
LFGTYWLGRTLTIWLGPLFMPSAMVTPLVATGLTPLFRRFQLLHAAPVVAAGVVGCVVLQ